MSINLPNHEQEQNQSLYDPFAFAGDFELPADLLPASEQDTRPVAAVDAPSGESRTDPAADAQVCADGKHDFETFPMWADDPILLCLECGATKDAATGTILYPGRIDFPPKHVMTPYEKHVRRTTETLDELARIHADAARLRRPYPALRGLPSLRAEMVAERSPREVQP